MTRRPLAQARAFAIRTGPADFSARLVTMAKVHGYRCTDGHLVDEDGATKDTPDEESFIGACGFPVLPPEYRR